jgi:starch-binding outer membrane protein, SusD/RagB family
MKKINSLKYLAGLVLTAILVLACQDDFLDRPPKDSIVDANFFKSDDQLRAASALLYNQVWFDYNGRASYNLGDFRSGVAYSGYSDRGSVEFNTTGDNQYNYDAWKSFFIVVAQSNLLIQNVKKYAVEGVSEEAKKTTIAEARFMRGVAYRYIASNWSDVPIIENNRDLVDNPLSVVKNTNESVWKFVTKDLLAAAKDLPEVSSQLGRVTKWSAEGMLAKVYLTRSGVEGGSISEDHSRKQELLDSAKYYANRVITLSGAELLSHYADLFEVPYDNNKESLFELQWEYTNPEDWGFTNTSPSDLGTSGTGNDDGWGGDKSATYWMMTRYEGFLANGKSLDQRLKATFMLPGARYEEVLSDVDGDGENEPLVVPFNDQESNWVNIKKYIAGKSTPENPSAKQRYDHDTYMLRLADIYLTYAEAALGNNPETSDPLALQYFNDVRVRAGLPALTLPNLPTLRPITLNDILSERFVEFAMEGVAWYDLVSLRYWKQSLAYSIISNQDRGLFAVEPNQMPDPTSWTITKTSWDTNRSFPANAGNFLLPIPNAEILANPNLSPSAEAVDYYGDN